jgi:AraC-like DNA-binding protein
MSEKSEHPFHPEPHEPNLGIMNRHTWNESPDGRDTRCRVITASALGRAEAASDAPAFAPFASRARIEVAGTGIEARTSSAPARDFVASIRQAIETLSRGEDYPTIRTTAEFVGMSVRTLQRRLAQAGASHHMLVAQARFATAAAVLERTDAKILELALDLGYSDHANFTRAFRRWAGCAPREYRRTRDTKVSRTLRRREARASEEPAPAPDLPMSAFSSASRTPAAHDTRPGSMIR